MAFGEVEAVADGGSGDPGSQGLFDKVDKDWGSGLELPYREAPSVPPLSPQTVYLFDLTPKAEVDLAIRGPLVKGPEDRENVGHWSILILLGPGSGGFPLRHLEVDRGEVAE